MAYILHPSLSLSSWHLPVQFGAEISERHSGAAYSLTEWSRMEDGRRLQSRLRQAAVPVSVNSALETLMLQCLMRYMSYLNAHRTVVEFTILQIYRGY